ncbi:TVP38/TMEM64 family protein [Candidatus Parcubacteria bacterium]|nr:MAG: TVP38/TMEM64 family protein [Candidatus Parcubacteria bacterium]
MEEQLAAVLVQYPLVAPVIFIFFRSLGILIPPIPGVFIDLIGIATFGWLLGFVYGEAGIMLGASGAFWIARTFREPAVRRIGLLRRVHEWEDKISERTKFWALVALRLPSNPVFDYVSYAAGLTKIGFPKFFFATLIGNVPMMLFVYYFGERSLDMGLYHFLGFLGVLALLAVLWSGRGLLKSFGLADKGRKE